MPSFIELPLIRTNAASPVSEGVPALCARMYPLLIVKAGRAFG